MVVTMKLSEFQPTHREVEQSDGSWIVYIKAPKFMGTPEVQVKLTADQFKRYLTWKQGPRMIQEALPEMSASEREKLMSGLDDENFQRIAKQMEE
jgi:hypothetical protein